MQYSALLVAVMATFAAAAPKAAPGGYGCTPATYACDGKHAWKVCNTEGQWVVSLSPNLATPTPQWRMGASSLRQHISNIILTVRW